MRWLLLIACSSVDLAPSDESTTESELCGALLPTHNQLNWRWNKEGVVPGIPEGVLAPTIVSVKGTLHIWFMHERTIKHASSADGVTFTTEATTGLRQGVTYPHAWYDGRFKMVHGSGSFDIAESEDGVHWTTTQPRVMTASADPSRFDALSLSYPSRVGDMTYFAAYDGRQIRIGRAVSYVVDPVVPVLDVGEGFDNTAVAQPHVRKLGKRYVMWYGGYDTSTSNPGPYRIGVAESDDGIVWTKRGVVIELGSESDAWSTRDPALVPVRGYWHMFYIGLGSDNVYRLHRASSCSLAVAEPS